MIVLFEIVLDITTVKLEAVAGGTFKLSTFKIMITIVVGINMSVIIIIIWIMMARDKIIIIIIIIWIMMARWAGDEIMNNPTIKSHIYMGPHPPWIIMMMRVIMITVELQICGIFNLQQRDFHTKATQTTHATQRNSLNMFGITQTILVKI